MPTITTESRQSFAFCAPGASLILHPGGPSHRCTEAALRLRSAREVEVDRERRENSWDTGIISIYTPTISLIIARARYTGAELPNKGEQSSKKRGERNK